MSSGSQFVVVIAGIALSSLMVSLWLTAGVVCPARCGQLVSLKIDLLSSLRKKLLTALDPVAAEHASLLRRLWGTTSLSCRMYRGGGH